VLLWLLLGPAFADASLAAALAHLVVAAAAAAAAMDARSFGLQV